MALLKAAEKAAGAWAFTMGLLALIAVVLALPVFPSGDGPAHIYFSRILYLLASHRGGVYADAYIIRHLVQPYSLHYFWLIALEQITSTAMAEKSFVAAILLVNALGFRFLARQLGGAPPGESSSVVALWIVPLLLSWALGSGFLNFCFAAGVLFLAYGLYLRLCAGITAGRVSAYVLALFLLVLSHPVPLLVLSLLLGGDAVLVWWCGRGSAQSAVQSMVRRLAPQGLALGLALVSFAFPMLIADKASVADSLLRDLKPHMAQLQAIVSGDRLSLFFSGTVAGVLFTAVLVALVPAAVVLLVRDGAVQRLRAKSARPADRLCLTALVLLAATIVFPQSMNGSALFADRMVPLLWPFLIVCAAAIPLSRMVARGSFVLATLAAAVSVVFALGYLLPVARQQQALTQAPLPMGARGLFIAAPVQRGPFEQHLAGELLTWGGARAFAAHNDVLLNSPWMQLTIVPVGERGRSGLLRDALPGSYSESPTKLAELLQTRSPLAERALSGAEFVLYSDPAANAATVRSAVRRYLPATQDWPCTVRDFYAVCVRRDAPIGVAP